MTKPLRNPEALEPGGGPPRIVHEVTVEVQRALNRETVDERLGRRILTCLGHAVTLAHARDRYRNQVAGARSVMTRARDREQAALAQLAEHQAEHGRAAWRVRRGDPVLALVLADLQHALSHDDAAGCPGCRAARARLAAGDGDDPVPYALERELVELIEGAGEARAAIAELAGAARDKGLGARARWAAAVKTLLQLAPEAT